MLNYLWGIMILLGLAVGIISGQVEAISNAAIDSAGEAVTLSITMLGIMSMWTGLIEVARAAGLMDKMTKGLHPVLHFLFPRIPKNHKANEYIAANMIANILGLGWAATPMGLKAMKELAPLERQRVANVIYQKTGKKVNPEEVQLKRASDEMCTFLVINISSLQVIPMNVIAYRSKYGSVNPVSIVAPGLLATMVSTLAGVFICRLCCRRGEKDIENGQEKQYH